MVFFLVSVNLVLVNIGERSVIKFVVVVVIVVVNSFLWLMLEYYELISCYVFCLF